MSDELSLSLAEWLVLGVLTQERLHGFAVAQLTAPGGELGRVWQVPKAVIYRAVGRLLEAGLVTPEGTEAGQGPQRTVYTATPQGREAARDWLATPVGHVRDIRSQLLLKLALLDRAGDDPVGLLPRQTQPKRRGKHDGRARQDHTRVPAEPMRLHDAMPAVEPGNGLSSRESDADIAGHLVGQAIPVHVGGKIRRGLPQMGPSLGYRFDIAPAFRTMRDVPANPQTLPKSQVVSGV